MPKKQKTIQCDRCGQINDAALSACSQCGTGLIKHAFQMDYSRIKCIHALAADKGLIIGSDDELYRLKLQSMGFDSCKDFKTFRHYSLFINELKKLPDNKAA